MANRVSDSSLYSSDAGRFEEPDLKENCCDKMFGNDSSNRIFMKITGVFAVAAILTLVIVLPVYFSGTSDVMDVADENKFDCLPEVDGTQEECERRNCTWSPSLTAGVPSCFFSGPALYSLDGDVLNAENGKSASLKITRNNYNFYGVPFSALKVDISYISNSILRIKITQDGVKRYEVPMDHPSPSAPSNSLYSADMSANDGRFGITIERKSTSKILFNTAVGEMIFADQFLQISTLIASEYIYGFGEHMHDSFKHNMNWKTYGMFSRDQGVGPNVNLYGVHPYFLCMEGDGNAYGVYFVNSNAMDVTLQPTPAVTYRSVGGIFDFYIFLGPSPEEVTNQYTSLIGRPYLPPYWSLGFQLSRYGYENLENLTRVVERNLAAGIPYDVQYSDIDYMERQLDFTIDNASYFGLEDYVKHLKDNEKMRYIIILDPAISGNETEPYQPFDDGVTENVFIKKPDGNIAWGKVWPDLPGVVVDTSKPWDYQTENYRAFAAFPDFYRSNTTEWWKKLTLDFHERIPFDGLWIDMNEPASFVHGSPSGCPDTSVYDNPPYHPHLASDNLYDKTLCMENMQTHPKSNSMTQHYNMHSFYGISQGPPTLEACRASTGERCIVISRSTYPGSGKTVGHWLGDNTSNWEHLAASIIGMLEFNLFGIPYIGADVCGFFQDTTYELCLRWMQLGAFYPFNRNHNGIGFADQDPAAFDEAFINATKRVLETRYTLLPYLYTLFYDAHLTGSTVVRPLMNQFPDDLTTYTIDRQFLWGPALLITPALEEGATHVTGYVPRGRWYQLSDGIEISVEQHVNFSTPLDHINLHVHGGHVIPTQQPASNTNDSRKNPLGLIVALDNEFKSSGKLFWDDGSSTDTIDTNKYALLSFTCESSTLTISTEHTPATLDVSGLFFNKISVFGIQDDVINNNVTIMSTSQKAAGSGDMDFTFTYSNNTLQIMELNLYLDEEYIIGWS